MYDLKLSVVPYSNYQKKNLFTEKSKQYARVCEARADLIFEDIFDG